MTHCQQCGRRPSEAEQRLIQRSVARDAKTGMRSNGWVCAECRQTGYPADGLCYHVVTIRGASR
jgi:hypothetical protein